MKADELYETNSFGHAIAMINTKMAAFESAQYVTQVSGSQFALDFAQNLGATIITDPEMLAEFTLTAGAGVGTALWYKTSNRRL